MDAIGSCTRCGTTYRLRRAGLFDCPECVVDPAYVETKAAWMTLHPQGHYPAPLVKARPIKGRVSPKHECDGACTSAKGDKCVCACGGVNHGIDHAFAGSRS